MKLIFFVVLMLSINVSAWQVSTKVNIENSGEIIESVVLTCNASESTCAQICGNQTSCYKVQELCYNCLGTAQNLLRVTFAELNQLYKNSGTQVSDTDLPKVFSARHIFVAAKSIFNFTTGIDSDEVRARFLSLCPSGSINPIVVLTTDTNHEPVEIKYVICDRVSSSEMYVLEYAPQISGPLEYINLKLN